MSLLIDVITRLMLQEGSYYYIRVLYIPYDIYGHCHCCVHLAELTKMNGCQMKNSENYYQE